MLIYATEINIGGVRLHMSHFPKLC
jgi:hypothetical protein